PDNRSDGRRRALGFLRLRELLLMALAELFVSAGDLRHRITIKEHAPAYDDYNRPVKATDGSDWKPIQPTGSFWAAIEPLSGREIIVAKEVAPTATHVIRMRYAPGITDE